MRECGLGKENPIYRDKSGGLLRREMMQLVDSFGHSEVNSYMLLGRLYLVLSYMMPKQPAVGTVLQDYVNRAWISSTIISAMTSAWRRLPGRWESTAPICTGSSPSR